MEACPVSLGDDRPLSGRVFSYHTCCHPAGQSQRGIYSPSVTIGQMGLFTFGAYALHTARVCKIILKYAHNKYYLQFNKND